MMRNTKMRRLNETARRGARGSRARSYSTPGCRARSGFTESGSAGSGFTLIELMVVLAIGAVVTSIVLGGFASVGANNRRTSCQVNLAQMYQSARLYAADNDNQVPPYAPNAPAGERGIGLWELYAFPADVLVSADRDTIAPPGAKPVERYLRSAKSLHCPNDYDTAASTSPAIPERRSENLYTDAGTFNPDYLSYQVSDNGTQTYLPNRTLTRGDVSDPDELWKRQLRHFVPDGSDPGNDPDFVRRPPTSDTVITWCSWHRNNPDKSVRVGYDRDIVLFWDGTVHSLPIRQDATTRGPYSGTSCTFPSCLAFGERKPPIVE